MGLASNTSSLERYVGEVLDDKYRLERLLGQGGMGAVYLATHLGTERYVALKLITPQFMRNEEFVERFKREARAAGRLRHPNVVDVTDFGFSGNEPDRVAYLVMEYLDGCTLSDVLIEEERLPLYWVVDILEQVCSAVHEAHQQGIVHRDLKPDNIWLEPNRLGGYRVKVLDFGIAKLAETGAGEELNSLAASASTLLSFPAPNEIAPSTAVLEGDTLLYPKAEKVQSDRVTQAIDDGDRTRLLDHDPLRTQAAVQVTTNQIGNDSTAGLTRVGAILGTPLYMSPEQCQGKVLDARSDIYSLGVIAYQMLAGGPPFTGDPTSVLRAHTQDAPPPLRERNPKLRKRVVRQIMTALEKDPSARPQTALAFSNALRGNADNLSALYRRAFALYSEYFPKFLKLSFIAHLPVIILTLALVAIGLFQPRMNKIVFIVGVACISLLNIPATLFAAWIISGMTAILVTQLSVAPLKPVELRPAFKILRARSGPFLRTGIRIFLRIIIGFILLVIPGFVMTIRYMLWSPVVLMEGIMGKAALKRARELASRSWLTVIVVSIIQILTPSVVNLIAVRLIGVTPGAKISHGIQVSSQFSQLTTIFVMPLLSIVPALLYLKMRQLGGETLTEVMAQLEEVEGARSNWQQRMRTRLTVNTPHTRT